MKSSFLLLLFPCVTLAAVTSQPGTWDLRPLAAKTNSSETSATCTDAAIAATPEEATVDYVCDSETLVTVTEAWVVKPINAQITRPAYTLIDGVLGTKEMARATIGTPCDVSKPTLTSGTYKYAQYDASGYVALCWSVR